MVNLVELKLKLNQNDIEYHSDSSRIFFFGEKNIVYKKCSSAIIKKKKKFPELHTAN